MALKNDSRDVKAFRTVSGDLRSIMTQEPRAFYASIFEKPEKAVSSLLLATLNPHPEVSGY